MAEGMSQQNEMAYVDSNSVPVYSAHVRTIITSMYERFHVERQRWITAKQYGSKEEQERTNACMLTAYQMVYDASEYLVTARYGWDDDEIAKVPTMIEAIPSYTVLETAGHLYADALGQCLTDELPDTVEGL